MRTAFAIVTVLGFAAGCSKSETVRPDPAATSPTSSPAPTTNPLVFPRLTNLPAPYNRIGQPCALADYGCGTDGTVAMVYSHAETGALPEGLLTMRVPVKDMMAADQKSEALVGFEEDRVWSSLSCMECRISGYSVQAVALKTAKDVDLGNFQARLSLPPSPLLRNAQAFRTALLAQKRT